MSAHDDIPISFGQIEAEGRYDLHFVVRLDTLQRCFQELQTWYNQLKER